MKSLFFFVFTFVLVFTALCNKDGNTEIEKVFISDDLQISKIDPNGKEYDIIDILNTSSSEDKSFPQTQKAGLTDYNSDDIDFKPSETSSSGISDALSHSLDVNRDWEAEKALKKLEQNVNEHQASINNLRKINLTKDQTIASLSTINDELLNEIKRIKAMGGIKPSESNILVKPELTQIDILKNEVMKLKNTLILKSKELDNLRFKNDSLEGRISELEVLPSKARYQYRDTITTPPANPQPLYNSIEKNLSATMPNVYSIPNVGRCSLEFDAVVTLLSGRNKEAFFTEFFILPISLDKALRDSPAVKLSDYKGISSHAELWAKSRENPYLYQNAQKNIRNVLLDLIEDGKGRRIRTDVDGYAKIADMKVGSFFITGTATLGKVGVTWDVPVRLVAGNNKISLTLENSAWSL
jgi:hypothetical protein